MSAVADSRAGGQRRTRPRWPRFVIMFSVPVILAIGAGYFYLVAGRYASTDDAYVKADMVQVSSDVGGRVVAIEVHENEKVKAGQVLFRLDDRNYRIALERAQAQLASARLQVDGMRATYRQKQADLKQTQNTFDYQQREFTRQQQLLAEHVTSQAKFDEAKNGLDMARQGAAAMEQQLAVIVANLGGDPNLPTDQNPMVQQAQAAVDQAQLDLSHTVISAPSEGIVTKVDKLPVGEYLNAATPAFALVSTQHVWIEANFKETDLTHMVPGQVASVDIDTYPDHTFTARVQSIGAGTGSEFSVLPPQNASGNWVKVVQRIPVRLVIEDGDENRPLRTGMSVNVEVDTGHRQPLLLKLDRVVDAITGNSAAAHTK
jgi:membrane fusion protein, multidrug efflux system